jgi:hypothetical protein
VNSWDELFNKFKQLSNENLLKAAANYYIKENLRRRPSDLLIKQMLPSKQFIADLLISEEKYDIYHDIDAQMVGPRIGERKRVHIFDANKLYLNNEEMPKSLNDRERKYIHDHSDRLDHLFKMVPPVDKDMIVFKLVEHDKNVQLGDTIVYKAHETASFHIDDIVPNMGEDDSIMAIAIPEGNKILLHPLEMSVILPRNTEVKVKIIEERDWLIYDEYVKLHTIYARASSQSL